jgi:3',5'-cyclic AMP phosphodiesterase CpdA
MKRHRVHHLLQPDVSIRRLTLVAIALALVGVFTPAARTQSVPGGPQRIILNLTDSPATGMAVTWRMSKEYQTAAVEYAEATPGTGFARSTHREPAVMQVLTVSSASIAYHYSAVMRALKPATTYVYRVGADSVWSEWNQFVTAEAGRAPFSFVWFGDPQDDILRYISRLFRQAICTAPQARFWLFSGDLTSEPEDDQWGELFEAQGFVTRTVPSVMVPGNHDLGFRYQGGSILRNDKGKKVRDRSVSPLWRAHLTLPENGIVGLEETSYTFDYQGVRFFMINSNDRLEDQARWMDESLVREPSRWTVVSFHHPLYSTGRERDDTMTREAFLPVFDKHHVDVVLTGHDHTYARSYKLVNGTIVPDNAPGTVYVVSSSGPKFYEYTSHYDTLMAKWSVHMQLYQVITVSGGQLTFRAYTADGALYDSFDLRK